MHEMANTRIGIGKKQVQYSKRFLRALQKRGANLLITSIGIHADSYREVFSLDAQKRLGHPYVLCFKMCVAMLANYIRKLPEDYKINVIFERNESAKEAIRVFDLIKNLDQELGKRLGICRAGSWEKDICLQPADLVAYETMRLLKGSRTSEQRRLAFSKLEGFNSFMGFYLDRELMEEIRPSVEASRCEAGGYLPMSRQFDPDYVEGDTWEDVERKNARFLP